MNTLIRSLCLVSLLGGCAAEDRDSPDQPAPRTAEKSAPSLSRPVDVQNDKHEATEAVRDYAIAQRDEFIADMKRSLARSQAELDRLSTKLEKVETSRRHDAEAARDDARQKWNRAKLQLDTAANATEGNWEEVKRDVNRTYTEFEDSVTTTRQWLADRIAPDETPTKTVSE
jgi:autotransporter translocation and assembly factor TamB